ncbi:hypothetical protein CQS04_05330 [Chryseomicrobium excrementi]|uniref:Uncharacterized protein n=1 Tax=Chryseomicrobium excrementi TaxID=2041346 RepID=A0A2M9EZE8_9BACL|nr:hypothetical protein CQS04_05330 [Chryseomicrobium excrementi]
MESFFYFNMFRNIISTFFQNGIWVVGFFFLLLRTYDNPILKRVSTYIVGIALSLLLIYSVLISI